MTVILQQHLPFAPWSDARTRRLPGTLPVEPGDWLRTDEAFAAQMAERTRLMAERPGEVHALAPEAEPAAQELLDRVLDELTGMKGYEVGADVVRRPDGVEVTLDRAAPLMTLGHLVQEDFCLMEQRGDEHVLTGAILCFPSSWTLAEKFGRPLSEIHVPVTPYDENVARRVQRLFDAIRPGQGLWRQNALLYTDPALFQPRPEEKPRVKPKAAPYLRSERQCLMRLPETRAVVFSIHTYVLKQENLTREQAQALMDHPIGTTH